MNKIYYVYRITNKILKKHYYGYRSSNIEPLFDLGINYFSSSNDKDFIKDQKENTSHYKYKVIKRFTSKEKALEFEIFLHNKFDVGNNSSFYNKRNQTSRKFDNTNNKYKSIISLTTGKIKQIKLESDIPEDYILGHILFCKLRKILSFTDGFNNIRLDFFNDIIPENFYKGFTHPTSNNHPNFGKHIFNDGVNEYFLTDEEALKTDFNRGKLNSIGMDSLKDKVIYNNGVVSKYFKPGEESSEFNLGRLESKIIRTKTFTEEHKLNISKNHADVSGSKHPNAKKYLIENINGDKFFTHGNVLKKCKELKLNYYILKEFSPNFVEKKTHEHSTIGWKITQIEG